MHERVARRHMKTTSAPASFLNDQRTRQFLHPSEDLSKGLGHDRPAFSFKAPPRIVSLRLLRQQSASHRWQRLIWWRCPCCFPARRLTSLAQWIAPLAEQRAPSARLSLTLPASGACHKRTLPVSRASSARRAQRRSATPRHRSLASKKARDTASSTAVQDSALKKPGHSCAVLLQGTWASEHPTRRGEHSLASAGAVLSLPLASRFYVP